MAHRWRLYAALFLATVLFLIATLPLSAELPEQPIYPTGDFKVTLGNTYYEYHIPKPYEPDGTWGVFLLLHGTNGTPQTQMSCFHHGARPNEDFFVKMKCVGIAPKSVGIAWENTDKVPLAAFDDFMKKGYKLDPKRVHVLGVSSGGFAAGRIGYERITTFTSITVVAASLLIANKGAVKLHKNRPVFFINGETDVNLKFARDDYDALVKNGNGFARLKVAEGQPHQVPYWEQFDLLYDWYLAVESGFDYPAKLEEAKKKLRSSLDASIALVREIESHPREAEFWEKLERIKSDINSKGIEKLNDILKSARSRPKEAIKELVEFEKRFEGFPCADEAAIERKKLEEKG